MAPRKPTAAVAKAAAKAKVMQNPITKQPPNSYTQSTDRALPKPKKVHPFVGEPAQGRLMNKQRKSFESNPTNGPDLGYRKPDGMTSHNYHFLMGGHRDLPDPVADINAPHKTEPGAVLMPRAEDLSGPELRKGRDILKHYGSNEAKVAHDSGQALDRARVSEVIASHPNANTQTPMGERFYEGPSEPHDKISESARRVVQHPDFPRSGDADKDFHLARQMGAVTNSATSPNNPFAENRQGRRVYPNNMAAESATYSGLENKDAVAPKKVGEDLNARGVPDTPHSGVGTYKSNMAKAAGAVNQMAAGTPMHELTLGSGRRMFDPQKAPKTSSYVTAHAVDYSHPDESTVTDVQEGSNMLPHLSTAKSVGFHQMDGNGSPVTRLNQKNEQVPVVHYAHPDETGNANKAPKSLTKGLPAGHKLTPAYENADPGKSASFDGKPTRRAYGNNRVEEALSKGGNILGAMNDRGARQAAAERGLSPSVDNAAGTNRNQANRWYQKKMDRPEDTTSMTNSYESLKGYSHPDHAWSTSSMLHDEHAPGESLHDMTRVSDYQPPINQKQFPRPQSAPTTLEHR